MRHGACNAHHLRKLQALIDIEKEDWAKSMHRLLERAHRATRFSRENGRDVPASLGARISRAWARILDHAIAFHEAQPPLRTGKRGRKKRRIGHNLALRLRKHKEGCLRSLTDPRTPFTNNEAERDLRMAKLRQNRHRYQPGPPRSLTYKRSGQSDLGSYRQRPIPGGDPVDIDQAAPPANQP